MLHKVEGGAIQEAGRMFGIRKAFDEPADHQTPQDDDRIYAPQIFEFCTRDGTKVGHDRERFERCGGEIFRELLFRKVLEDSVKRRLRSELNFFLVGDELQSARRIVEALL